MEGYTIAELCEKFNITKRTLYYYMSIGLLPPAKSRGKYNRYPESFAQQVEKILRLRNGMKLTQIQRMHESLNPSATNQIIISIRIACENKAFMEYCVSAISKEVRRLSMQLHEMVSYETGEALIIAHPASIQTFNLLDSFCRGIENFSSSYNGGIPLNIHISSVPFNAFREEDYV